MRTALLLGVSAIALMACSPKPAPQQTTEDAPAAATPSMDVASALTTSTLPEVAAAIADGRVTSEAMVRAYLQRIEKLDRDGPAVNSVLSLNPDAIADAREADAARANGEARGALHGVPVLLKDNIETRDPVATTAGSYALKDNLAAQDAPLAAGLRQAGAIILGKTNLSQWANFRSSDSVSGWSAVGGVVRNPHMLSRSACGSSSGSGAATAAGFAAATVGTETNGSVNCPASMNGIVGFKPTVGLVSQTGIVPISSSQDTAGPMTRSVRGAAMMLNAMTPETNDVDFTATLDDTFLQGKRIGVLRFGVGDDADVQALFADALKVLEQQGAQLVDIDEMAFPDGFGDAAFTVLKAEFKHTLNAYLATTDPAQVPVRTLEDLIAFNSNTPAEGLLLFDQAHLLGAQEQPDLTDASYIDAAQLIQRATREDGIDKLLVENSVDLLVAPSRGPAFIIDAFYGDQYSGGTGAGYLAAIAGYPNITVPMGHIHRLPVGIDFMSGAGEDAQVLAAAYDYEQATQQRIAPQFLNSAFDVHDVGKLMKPPHQR